jgi:hypothetical protein
MDLYCNRCGEPFELLGITDEFTPQEKKDFYSGKGCPCCIGKPTPVKVPFRAKAMAVLQDVLGDDIDGIAAELEDAEGMFDFNSESGEREEDADQGGCSLCGGRLEELGKLGNKTHYRCVNCGMQSEG